MEILLPETRRKRYRVKVLVTGHKGYIGSNLYKSLRAHGYETVGIDLKDGEDVLYCLPKQKFDYVFHLAALPSVQFSVENPSYSLRHNVLATSVILEWAKNYGVSRVIFSSSAAASNIKSPYGLHKRMSEMECKLYSDLYKIDTVCLRYFNVYSEDQAPSGPYSTVISAWMEGIREKKPLQIDGDGEQARDFIHLSDIVNANLFAMQCDENFSGQCYDIGSGSSAKLNQIKHFIDARHEVSWIHRDARQGDIRESTAKISPFVEFGWGPCISIEEGLKRCFKKAS